MSIFNTVKIYRNVYRNWFSILFKMWRIQKKKTKETPAQFMKATLRTEKLNIEVPLGIVSSYAHLMNNENPRIHNAKVTGNLLSFFYDDHEIKFDFGNSGEIYASFINEEYNFLDVENKNVIDIGANIGDTAIYFALKGAKKVLSLEPYPTTFALAENNIEMSEFKDKIQLINSGYGKDRMIKIDSSFIPDTGSEIVENSKGIDIEIVSLETVIEKYGINSDVLTMDCEGCEYNLLNEKSEILGKFSKIQIEYHYGYEKLVDKLEESGFDTKFTSPIKIWNPSAGKIMIIGYVYGKNRRSA